MSNELKDATVIELLEAAERHYRDLSFDFADGLKHAIEICDEDGWMLVAPAWLDS